MDVLRRALTAVSVLALVATLVLAGDARQAAANSDCDQTNPQADVSVSQTVSGIYDANNTLNYLRKTVTLVNAGPCNVPDVALYDILPVGSGVVAGSISSNPSSWSCPTIGSTTIDDVDHVTLTCTPTSTMGVPGKATISVTMTLPTGTDWTDLAQAFVGGGQGSGDLSAGCTDPILNPTPTTTCDTNTTNNTSWASYLTPGGGSVSACNAKGKVACDQSTSVVATGTPGSAQIQNLTSDSDPSVGKGTCKTITGFANCFGNVVAVTSSVVGATKTFKVSAALTTESFSSVNIINSTNGSSWSIVPACNKTTTMPCVQSKKRTNENNQTYYVFTVLTDVDDSWGFE